MFLIDTNVLIHAVRRESTEYGRMSAFIRKLPLRSDSWALSWNIIYEFLRIATHPRVFANPLTLQQAVDFISVLLNCPNCLLLSETGLHAEMLTEAMAEAPRLNGNILHDFHTAVLMREHGISDIITFDQDFRTFPWVTIQKP